MKKQRPQTKEGTDTTASIDKGGTESQTRSLASIVERMEGDLRWLIPLIEREDKQAIKTIVDIAVFWTHWVGIVTDARSAREIHHPAAGFPSLLRGDEPNAAAEAQGRAGHCQNEEQDAHRPGLPLPAPTRNRTRIYVGGICAS
jgi:hypothetical protein